MDTQQVISLTLPTLHCYLEQYNIQYAGNPSTEETWLYSTAQALYYAYPIVLLLSLVTSLTAAIVTAKMAVESHDCYLTAFNGCSAAMLLFVALSQSPTYISGASEAAWYQAVLPYLICLQNWFWCAATWTLATAVLERGFANLSEGQSGGPKCYGCGRVHGGLVSALVIFVSFVNTLPQFWEYESVETQLENSDNCTHVGIRTVESLVNNEEYYAYHWYATVVTSILPYVLLPMFVPAIICTRGYYYTSVTSVSSKSPALKYYSGASSPHENSSPMKEQMTDEKEFNRLLAALLVLYLLLGGPYVALRMTAEDHVGLTVLEGEPQLRVTLVGLFEVLFWFFFLVAFFLQLIVSHMFRGAMSRLCRCKKEQQRYYY